MVSVPQLIILCFLVAVILIPYWKIFGKAGWSPWLALLMLVPLANVVLLYVFAFSDWPATTRTAD